MGTDHSISKSHAVGHGHIVHEYALVNLNARADLAIGAQDRGLDVDLGEGRREEGGGREGGTEKIMYVRSSAEMAVVVCISGLDINL